MPRKTLKERREQNPTDDNSNRVRAIVDAMTGVDSKADIMNAIQQTLTPSSKRSVIPGGLYTFVYNAKTPGIIYDPFPLVGVVKVFDWGFVGVNLHWGDEEVDENRRQYSWDQIISPVYEIQQEEKEDMKRLSYGDFSQSPSK
jgi:hypothetical protein